MESSSSSDSIKKFVVFVCKICQDEYLDLKEFILHKRAHAAAAAAAAELAQTNQAEKQNVTPTDSQSDTSSDMDTDSQKEEELTPNSDTGTDASVPGNYLILITSIYPPSFQLELDYNFVLI